MIKRFNFLFTIILFFHSATAHALMSFDHPIKRYLSVTIGNDMKEIAYMHGTPHKSSYIKPYNVKSDIYLDKEGVDYIFSYTTNKEIQSAICVSYIIRSGCNLQINIHESNGTFWRKKKERIKYMGLQDSEDGVITDLGEPSKQRISGNLKEVFYKPYNLYLQYISGKIVLIAVGQIEYLNFYSLQYENWLALRQSIYENQKKKADANERVKKLVQEMEAEAARVKAETAREEVKKIALKAEQNKKLNEFESSHFLNGIKIGEPLRLVISRYPHVIFISNNAGEKKYRIQTHENLLKCTINPRECEKTNGLLPGDHIVYSDHDDRVTKIMYACNANDSITSYGLFFGKVGCGQGINELESELISWKIYCHSQGGSRLYSAIGFRNFSSNSNFFYEFSTLGDRVEYVALTTAHDIPTNYSNCGNE